MNAGLPAGGTHAEPGEFHFPGPDVPGGGSRGPPPQVSRAWRPT